MPREFERATSVTIIRPYIIDVTFTDGHRRQVDIEPLLWGDVFAPLRDPDLFQQASVDPVGGSVYWPTGADLAPEFLFFGDEGPPPDYLRGTASTQDEAAAVTKAR